MSSRASSTRRLGGPRSSRTSPDHASSGPSSPNLTAWSLNRSPSASTGTTTSEAASSPAVEDAGSVLPAVNEESPPRGVLDNRAPLDCPADRSITGHFVIVRVIAGRAREYHNVDLFTRLLTQRAPLPLALRIIKGRSSERGSAR